MKKHHLVPLVLAMTLLFGLALADEKAARTDTGEQGQSDSADAPSAVLASATTASCAACIALRIIATST